MSEPKQQREYHVPVWGIFLLFLGVVFLLQTFNVLPWGLWGTLWRFWPVLLIVIGLSILLRRSNPWLVGALILVLLFASLGIAICQYGPSLPAGGVTKSYSEPLGSLERAQIQINFNAGSLTMRSLPPDSPNFVEAASGRGNGDMKVVFQNQDGEGSLFLSTERTNRRFWDEAEAKWEVRFNRTLPLTIDIKSAVGNLDLDLSELAVTELQMDIDAGNCMVTMPSSTGTTHAYIKADVANIEVTIPEGVAAKLKVDTDLSAFEINESRFPRKGDYYISPDFESAKNRIELELDCDIGRVQVK